MAVEVVLLLTLTSVCLGSTSKLVDVKCQPAVGIVGQNTKISCSFKTSFENKTINITSVTVTKKGDVDPLFWMKDGAEHGDTRIKLPSTNDPSLLIANTAVSDEGQYDYMVMTNCGIVPDGTFRISVTAKYNLPSTSTRPDKVVVGSPADFYCNASGGYPAGAIHWFDNIGTNWTKSATLEITEGEDRLLHLSSKLSFKSIDSNWAPFRCVILNSKFITEGESTKITLDKLAGPASLFTESKVASSVAGVLVIGVIIAGLLIALLYRRKRHSQQDRRPSTQPILRGFHGRNQNVEAAETEDPLEPNGEAVMLNT